MFMIFVWLGAAAVLSGLRGDIGNKSTPVRWRNRGMRQSVKRLVELDEVTARIGE
jgi:hypothetical protein